ncbi:Uncharacterised protein [Chlamydia trachomatis]|nr:Uncharacterised protein [Chlamydia trachomatis]
MCGYEAWLIIKRKGSRFFEKCCDGFNCFFVDADPVSVNIEIAFRVGDCFKNITEWNRISADVESDVKVEPVIVPLAWRDTDR